jgi:hypothetical protein
MVLLPQTAIFIEVKFKNFASYGPELFKIIFDHAQIYYKDLKTA